MSTETCPACGGDGTQECNYCNGEGSETCSTCDGTGQHDGEELRQHGRRRVSPAAKPGLTIDDIAERTGLKPSTIRDYLANARRARAAGRPGLFPEPDIPINARTSLWSVEVIEAWEASRPGRGKRTDLTQDDSGPTEAAPTE